MKVDYVVYDSTSITIDLLVELRGESLYEETYLASRFKRLYDSVVSTGELDKQLTVVVAYCKKKPIGVSMFEWTQQKKFPLRTLKNPARHDSKIDFHFDKSFKLFGWFQVYVAKPYRSFGVATKLTCEMESAILADKLFAIDRGELPLVIAEGMANDLVKGHMKYCYPLQSHKRYLNFDADIHENTMRFYMAALDGKAMVVHEETCKLTKVKNNGSMKRNL